MNTDQRRSKAGETKLKRFPMQISKRSGSPPMMDVELVNAGPLTILLDRKIF
jgi:D-Tyr-tRNAtyr deacylase